MSLGARRDYGASQAQNRLLEPSTIYPTANVRDLVLVEDVLLDAGYTPVLIGTPRKGATNYRLVSQKEDSGAGFSSVFSMMASVTPLPMLLQLASRHDRSAAAMRCEECLSTGDLLGIIRRAV